MAKHAQSAKSALTTQQFATACLDAARAEQRGFARNAAIDWAEKGIAVECDVTTRFDLLLTLGNAHNDNDDLRGAARAYQDAYDIAETIPRQRAAAAILIARTWSDPGQVDERSVHLLKADRDALRPDDSAEAAALRSQLNAHLARKLTMSVVQYEQQPPGVLLARNTIASLPTDVNDSVRCEVLNECRWALYDYTPPNELLSISGQLRDASIRARSVYFHSEALVALAIDQIRLDRLDDAFGTVSRHGRYVTQNNRPLGSWLQHTLETMRQLWTGEFDAAESWLYGESVQVVSGLLRSPAVPGDTLHQTRMGQVYWFLHERGLMRQRFQTDLATNVQQHGYFPIWQAGRVLALCDLEAHDTAFDQLTVLMRETSDFASLPPHGWAVPTLALLAEACAALHLTQSVTDLAPFINRLLELLAPHSGQVALAGWPTVLIGPVDRFIGILLLAAGDAIEALAYLERAEKVVAAAPPQLARLRLDQARAIVAISGARSAGLVVDLLRRAGKSAEELKMQQLVTQIQTLLAELDESS